MKIEHVPPLVRAPVNCLNPYSNGMKIELPTFTGAMTLFFRLNPYSNGMKIELNDSIFNRETVHVLILILME